MATWILAATLSATLLHAGALERGTARFQPPGDQKNIPQRYRLDAHDFSWEMEPLYEFPHSRVAVSQVRFPSPVVTKDVENNTVHCLYYRPMGPGPFPAVIVLDITAGDQTVSRAIATHLAANGVGALFMQMAYYGPRRPAGMKQRMITANYTQSLANVRQTVLDVRQSAAWLAAQPEVDAKRVGVLGTSLGSFTAALAGEMDPRLTRVVILLGGGGLVDAYYDHPLAAPYRKGLDLLGGKSTLKKLLAPVDPLTCAANLQGRHVLMIAARRDEIVYPRMAEALWKAAGEPKIVWYDCTHYGAALYFVAAMGQVVSHLQAD